MEKNPIELSAVVKEPEIRALLQVAFDTLDSTHESEGGITIQAVADKRNPERPRALVKVGPLSTRADHMAMRKLVAPKYTLSHVRNFVDTHATATASKRYGY
jgi:hypothetical protein